MPDRGPLPPETVVLDQLRSRWLEAIVEFGPVAARNDAIGAFMQRMGCSRAEAEDLVDRAWAMLNLDVLAALLTPRKAA